MNEVQREWSSHTTSWSTAVIQALNLIIDIKAHPKQITKMLITKWYNLVEFIASHLWYYKTRNDRIDCKVIIKGDWI